MPKTSPGILFVAAAYVIWGLLPLYFRHLTGVPAMEIVLHRTLWSFVVMLSVLALMRRWRWILPLVRQPRQLGLYAVSAALLAANWLLYVWAVQQHRVVDASLGYFINPLVSVLLGVVVLKERLRRLQWAAVALATLGVLWLTWQSGRLPWVSLALASSFALYSLMRKTAPLGALEALAAETSLLAPIALGFLLVGWWGGGSAAGVRDATTIGWLMALGPLTALTLVLFAAGARRMSLTAVGLTQYVSPTIQLALGLWVFNEPFAPGRLAGFVLIWAGLGVFAVDGLIPRWVEAGGRTPH